MSAQVNITSLYQAVFSILLACVHLLACYTTSELWLYVAIVSSFWFFLILPVLLLIAFCLLAYESIKNMSINRLKVIYLAISLLSYPIFVAAINSGCYATV
ncbi:MAG: hypothetical protein AAF434_00800 [Pseudomonadota bacterium]